MFFVLDVPVGNLRSNMAVFVPCDHQPAKGLLLQVSSPRIKAYVSACK